MYFRWFAIRTFRKLGDKSQDNYATKSMSNFSEPSSRYRLLIRVDNSWITMNKLGSSLEFPNCIISHVSYIHCTILVWSDVMRSTETLKKNLIKLKQTTEIKKCDIKPWSQWLSHPNSVFKHSIIIIDKFWFHSFTIRLQSKQDSGFSFLHELHWANHKS